MSLVNDALRRAQDAQKKSQPVAPGPQFRPAEPAEPAKRSMGIWVSTVIAMMAIVALILALENRRKAEAREPVAKTKPAAPVVGGNKTAGSSSGGARTRTRSTCGGSGNTGARGECARARIEIAGHLLFPGPFLGHHQRQNRARGRQFPWIPRRRHDANQRDARERNANERDDAGARVTGQRKFQFNRR